MVRTHLARIAAAMLGLGLAFAAFGQHSHGKGGSQRPDLGASAAFDANGTLWSVHKEGDHVVLRRSSDKGATWSAAERVNAQPEPVAADGDSRPRVALGRGGDVYVTWTQPLPRPYTGFIRFARSIDGAKSFTPPVTVHADRQPITHRFDSIAVTPQGKIFVAWIDKRDAAAATDAYRGAALYYAVSDDRGATFRGDFRAAHHSCECCRIALVPQDDGTVLAMWRHVFEPNVRDHALVRLGPDGVASDMRRVTFDDWRIDACPHHGPSMAKDAAGRLHAVWFSGTRGKEGVYYGRLRDGGVDGLRRVGGDTAAHADLAAIGNRIVIAWKEFDGTRSVLRALRSDDGGNAWTEEQLATSAGATDQPKVLVSGNDFHVLWNSREQPLRVLALPAGNPQAALEPRAFGPASLDAIRKAHAGKPFVLSLWSVHCEPCRHEMPLWKTLQRKYPAVRVVLVAADKPDEDERIRRFLALHDPGPVERWRYADDFEERIRFSIDPKWRGELPRTYFFDADHRVVTHTGVPEAQWTERWFEHAAAAQPR